MPLLVFPAATAYMGRWRAWLSEGRAELWLLTPLGFWPDTNRQVLTSEAKEKEGDKGLSGANENS